MASLRDHFGSYYAPSADAIESALRTGLVSLDTNVLLSLYRLQPQARDELVRVLRSLGDRLWVPHQVALEFHQNRLNVIAEQERFFDKAKADLKAAIDDYTKKFRAFANRISLADTTVQKLIDEVSAAHAAIRAEVASAEQANEIHLHNHNTDDILALLEALLTDRIGDPMSADELGEARKEAKRRIEAKIPPGFMDREKSDPTGDYVLWKQLINEASKRQIPVVLITDDRKEDWFRRQHGLTLGPRIELCEEMQRDAGASFFLMTTESFLILAKEHLSAPVSSATVNQAKELPASVLEERVRDSREEYSMLREEVGLLNAKRISLDAEIRSIDEITQTTEITLATGVTPLLGGGDQPGGKVLSEPEKMILRRRIQELQARRQELVGVIARIQRDVAKVGRKMKQALDVVEFNGPLAMPDGHLIDTTYPWPTPTEDYQPE
jgi:uncharacterized protein YlxW (UPF0749 family)